MRVFVTGATGFVGSAVVQDLLKHGHTVVGLSRSEENAAKLKAAGAEALPGDLTDLESLKKGAAESDGVIHCGFIHDFQRFAEVCAVDAAAIKAMGDALAGTDKPLIVSSGVAIIAPGKLATEDMKAPELPNFPRVSEKVAFEQIEKGVRAMAVRLPPTTHGDGDHGFMTILIGVAKEKGYAAYVGDGANVWPATHRFDAASVYRLALEKGKAGASYHAIAEQGVTFKEIEGMIGRKLGLPVKSITAEEAAGYYGWFAHFATLSAPSSSEKTQAELGWTFSEIELLPDMDAHYFGA
jgi:nucleoside-diphosphate-sugar epimerase